MYRRAGCLLVPFLPVRAAGGLVVTNKRIIFDPIFHYKLVTRRFAIDLEEVTGAEAAGSNVSFSMWEIVSIGKLLTIKTKKGMTYPFRSNEADLLAEAINHQLQQRQG